MRCSGSAMQPAAPTWCRCVIVKACPSISALLIYCNFCKCCFGRRMRYTGLATPPAAPTWCRCETSMSVAGVQPVRFNAFTCVELVCLLDEVPRGGVGQRCHQLPGPLQVRDGLRVWLAKYSALCTYNFVRLIIWVRGRRAAGKATLPRPGASG